MAYWMAAPIQAAMAWQQEFEMKGLLAAILIAFAGVAVAADGPIKAEGEVLFGAKIGEPVESALPKLIAALGEPTGDTGRVEGCPVDGSDERHVDWGGMGAQFFEDENSQLVFERWTYRIDYETGQPIPGGPQPDRIELPGGIRMGDPFSKAADVWGFTAKVDEVFEIAWYFGRHVAIMTANADINGPIVEIGVPTIGACE